VELGERIRVLRTKKRLSQGDLAKAVESATSTISEIERGERKPRTELLVKMADYFDVSIDILLGRIPEEKSREFAELKTEMDTLRKDYKNLSAKINEFFMCLREIPPPVTVPAELLMEIPDTINENTRARLEGEFGLSVRTSRLEDMYVDEIFRYLLIIEIMKEKGWGLSKKEQLEQGEGETRSG